MAMTTAEAPERLRLEYSRPGPPPAGIGEVIEDRLHRSGYFALRDVSCLIREGDVHLVGRLPSFFLKQIAQEIAAGVEGVRLAINRIDVPRLPSSPEGRPRRGY